MTPKLRQPEWIKDRVRALAQAGYIVVIPESRVTINQWRGTGWAVIDPYTGLGAYIIAGGMYYANATAPQVAAGGWSTVPVNMSESLEEFQYYAMNLSEGLEEAEIDKSERAAELIRNIFLPAPPLGLLLGLYAVYTGFVTGVITIGVALGVVGLLIAPLALGIIYIGVVDPAGEVFLMGGVHYNYY